ncbi:MAG: hypothetical protein LBE36_13555 [Flavobacteriaceae bacterium]|jgi:hypothetical protein|nr:hypothetical protein [Flavobacteriaceae bacterium]
MEKLILEVNDDITLSEAIESATEAVNEKIMKGWMLCSNGLCVRAKIFVNGTRKFMIYRKKI